MDDCSPDNTGEVAMAFSDPRVKYVRHPQNIGHLRNYNEGIRLAKGRYIWLISADDRLRRPYALARFVETMDRHPSAAYIFCPSVKFDENGDTGIAGSVGDHDAVINGRHFVRTLLHGNIVPAPAGMVRREAYERVGGFPLDLPFAGDWYMWAAFAFHGDVAYLSEPMVDRRVHSLNMTKSFFDRAPALVKDEIEVLWRVKTLADEFGPRQLSRRALDAVAKDYAARVGRRITEEWAFGLTIEECEASQTRLGATRRERLAIGSRVYAALGDAYLETGRRELARAAYVTALRSDVRALRTLAKAALLMIGPFGVRLRARITSLRDATL
jgi:glycosyltransferase involved in cell wall biosynthesis